MTTTANSIASVIAAVASRTLANRRIEQAKARIAKADEAIKFDQELIAALQAHHDTLPVEAGSLTAVAGQTIKFKTGRAESVREETGVVQLVDGAKYKVLVGTGFDQEFKTIFAGQITEVTPLPAADDLGLDA
uniref:Uncharacterized protein n=1 Tax=feces metagenome TaxID=1861841 RepID=A0A7M2QN33_9ZZZZ